MLLQSTFGCQPLLNTQYTKHFVGPAGLPGIRDAEGNKLRLDSRYIDLGRGPTDRERLQAEQVEVDPHEPRELLEQAEGSPPPLRRRRLHSPLPSLPPTPPDAHSPPSHYTPDSADSPNSIIGSHSLGSTPPAPTPLPPQPEHPPVSHAPTPNPPPP